MLASGGLILAMLSALGIRESTVWWYWAAIIVIATGYLGSLLMAGGFYDLIAAFLVKTKHFSCVYSEGVGLRQGIAMGVGVLLLLYSAIKYEEEFKVGK